MQLFNRNVVIVSCRGRVVPPLLFMNRRWYCLSCQRNNDCLLGTPLGWMALRHNQISIARKSRPVKASLSRCELDLETVNHTVWVDNPTSTGSCGFAANTSSIHLGPSSGVHSSRPITLRLLSIVFFRPINSNRGFTDTPLPTSYLKPKDHFLQSLDRAHKRTISAPNPAQGSTQPFLRTPTALPSLASRHFETATLPSPQINTVHNRPDLEQYPWAHRGEGSPVPSMATKPPFEPQESGKVLPDRGLQGTFVIAAMIFQDPLTYLFVSKHSLSGQLKRSCCYSMPSFQEGRCQRTS
jgi:hypothetical protein